jgi:putative acyl-CoA dehydrogenase
MTFYQQPPTLGNEFEDDDLLKSYLKAFLPVEFQDYIFQDLKRFGELVTTEILQLGTKVNETPPKLINFDAWGNRVDNVIVCDEWEKLHQISAVEGLIAIGYERKFGEFSRLYQMAKLHLFTPSSSIYTCPLAMSDGATRLIELHAKDELQGYFIKLTSRNPDEFWVSGQWMTERSGGSDVSGTETIAKPLGGNKYELIGDKWFTSAVTANLAMTLAKIEDGSSNNSLSLFCLETKNPDGSYNGIKLHRLKDKLGTKGLPTGELTLDSCVATKIGSNGEGVKLISTILNITRIYNAISSVSYMRRGLSIAKDYASKRFAFGRALKEHPLHIETLAQLESEYITNFLITYYVVELLGKSETGVADKVEEKVLRLLTPVIKLYTAKNCVKVMSEVLEAFGGAGYVEDTGLPVLLRDAQVFTIWEGTTNVLSLDVLRAIKKEDVINYYYQWVEIMLDKYESELKSDEINTIHTALDQLKQFLKETTDENVFQANARDFSFTLAKITIAILLLRAIHTMKGSIVEKLKICLKRICKQGLILLEHSSDRLNENNFLLFSE